MKAVRIIKSLLIRFVFFFFSGVAHTTVESNGSSDVFDVNQVKNYAHYFRDTFFSKSPILRHIVANYSGPECFLSSQT